MEFLNVLIIRPGAIGDTLMVLPALAGLSKDILVTFAGSRPGIDFIADNVHNTFDTDRLGWHRLFMDSPEGIVLPVSITDLAIAFFNDEDGTIKGNLKSCYPGAGVFLFPSVPPKDKDLHTAQYIAECLARAGLVINPQQVFEDSVSKGVLFDKKAPENKSGLVVHPGSGSPVKNYSLETWMDILQNLSMEAEKRELHLTVLLGPAEKFSYNQLERITESLHIEIVQVPDKEKLVKILSGAAVYIGHDSGITHLAAMLGSWTIALFISTDVHRWRPLGPRVKIVHRDESYPELAMNIVLSVRSVLDQEGSG